MANKVFVDGHKKIIAKGKEKIIIKDSAVVKVGDKVLVYGMFLEVIKTNKMNRHPIQLVELYFAEFREPLRIPAGWQIKVEYTE